jgi:CBS domain containing-hemolysin-like protein
MVWISVACCLLVSFVFSGIEAGILSVNRIRLQHRVRKGDRAAIKLKALLIQPERFLVTVLMVTNFMNIVAVVLTTGELVRWLGSWGYVAAFFAFLPFYLFVVELLPKSLFRRFPYRALAFLAEPLHLADLVLSPIHFVGSRFSHHFFRDLPVAQKKLFVAREDFKYLTIESERMGDLSHTERQLIHNVIDFRSVKTGDVMSPMGQIQTISARAKVSDLLERALETGFERWPVRDDSGAITGLVDALDLAFDAERDREVKHYQRPIVTATPGEPAYAVLRRLRAARMTLALVAEPSGPPLGIVSSEDLIKRLVDAPTTPAKP